MWQAHIDWIGNGDRDEDEYKHILKIVFIHTLDSHQIVSRDFNPPFPAPKPTASPEIAQGDQFELWYDGWITSRTPADRQSPVKTSGKSQHNFAYPFTVRTNIKKNYSN